VSCWQCVQYRICVLGPSMFTAQTEGVTSYTLHHSVSADFTLHDRRLIGIVFKYVALTSIGSQCGLAVFLPLKIRWSRRSSPAKSYAFLHFHAYWDKYRPYFSPHFRMQPTHSVLPKFCLLSNVMLFTEKLTSVCFGRKSYNTWK
jgi:hypothetical protein